MSKIQILGSVFALTAAACGGDDDTTPVSDAGILVDAGQDSGTVESCGVGDVTGSPLGFTGAYLAQNGDQMEPYFATAFGGVDDDFVQVSIWPGLGVFTQGATPGTYTIEGAETDFDLCGLCIVVGTDFDTTTGAPNQLLFASGGTVVLETADIEAEGTLALTASDLTFREVGTAPPYADVSDGCTTSISSLDIDVTLTDRTSEQ